MFQPALALNLAWREMRSTKWRTATALLAVAFGVATMTSVRSISTQSQFALHGDVRQWLAADLVLELPDVPSEERIRALPHGGRQTTLTLETYGQLVSTQSPDPLLVAIKVIDPEVYPFYGNFRIDPDQVARTALAENTFVAGRDVLDRLHIRVGETVRLAGKELRATAILREEPDRVASSRSMSPRIILSHAALKYTRLLQSGTRVVPRLLVKVDRGGDTSRLRAQTEAAFPDATLIDYRDVDYRSVAALEAGTVLIAMAGWIALLLGALAAGMVTYLQMNQRLDSIATMKSLGATNRLIMTAHLTQSAIVALAGSLLGVGFGVLLERVFLHLAGSRLPVPLHPQFDFNMALQNILIGVGACLASVAGPVWSVRKIPPLLVLRRHFEAATSSGLLLRAALLCVAIAGLGVAWQRASIGGAFAGGLALGAVLLGMTTAWLCRLLARRQANSNLPYWARAGFANLDAEGSRPSAMLTGLACGVMWLCACWVGQEPVSKAILESMPFPGSDLYLLWVSEAQMSELMPLLHDSPDVQAPVEHNETAVMRLVSVNGLPFDTWQTQLRRFIPQRHVVVCREDLHGALLSNINAGVLDVSPGMSLELRTMGHSINVPVERIEAMDAFQSFQLGFQLPCGPSQGMNHRFEIGVKAKPGQLEALRRTLADRFPALTVVNSEEVAAPRQAAGQRAILLLGLIALLVMACGSAILAMLVAVAKQQRMHQIALSKALGAKREVLIKLYTVEFGTAGVIAGLTGSVFGCAFSSLVVSVIFQKPIFAGELHVIPLLTGGTAIVAAASGWLTSYRTLSLTPLHILRQQ